MTSHEYLQSLSSHLKSLPAEAREEILLEISSHIQDSLTQPGANLDEILARLGTPERVAAAYRDNILLRRARRSFSPVVMARAIVRLATKGVFGFIVFLCATIGYCIGGTFVLIALLKPIFPNHTGMWIGGPDAFTMGVQLFPPGPPAHEVLGRAIIPICLVLGTLILGATMVTGRLFLRTSRFVQEKFQPSPQPLRQAVGAPS